MVKKEIENDDGWGSDLEQELKEVEEEIFFKKVNKKWVNPVTIKPAIKTDEKFDFVNKFKEGEEKYKNANPPIPVNSPKPPSSEELNDLVNYEGKKITKKKAIPTPPLTPKPSGKKDQVLKNLKNHNLYL